MWRGGAVRVEEMVYLALWAGDLLSKVGVDGLEGSDLRFGVHYLKQEILDCVAVSYTYTQGVLPRHVL